VNLAWRNIETATANDKDVISWDSGRRGFGLRIKPSGAKSYLMRYRHCGKSKRLTIGSATGCCRSARAAGGC